MSLVLGKDLLSIDKRAIAKFAGGTYGCSHLVDLLVHAAKAYQDSKLTEVNVY